MTPLSFALCAMLCASTPGPLSPSDELVRGRAWKVTLAGSLISLVGVGFLVAGSLLLDTNPLDTALNTGHAFQTGGVLLSAAGVVTILLSLPMWWWRTQGPATPALTVAIGPGSLRLSW